MIETICGHKLCPVPNFSIFLPSLCLRSKILYVIGRFLSWSTLTCRLPLHRKSRCQTATSLMTWQLWGSKRPLLVLALLVITPESPSILSPKSFPSGIPVMGILACSPQEEPHFERYPYEACLLMFDVVPNMFWLLRGRFVIKQSGAPSRGGDFHVSTNPTLQKTVEASDETGTLHFNYGGECMSLST